MQITKSKFNGNRTVENTQRSYYFMDIVGLSTDTKPTNFNGNYVEEGSTFFEENTSKVYMMKADGTWVEI